MQWCRHLGWLTPQLCRAFVPLCGEQIHMSSNTVFLLGCLKAGWGECCRLSQGYSSDPEMASHPEGERGKESKLCAKWEDLDHLLDNQQPYMLRDSNCLHSSQYIVCV